MTELVVVIAIAAVIMVAAGPRFVGRAEFDERAFADEVTSALAYARQLAVATGCPVRVQLAAGGYELRQRAACQSGAWTEDVRHPGTTAPSYAGAPPAGLGFGSTEDPVFFDPLGRATDGASPVNATVTVGARTLQLAGETGYVDAP